MIGYIHIALYWEYRYFVFPKEVEVPCVNRYVKLMAKVCGTDDTFLKWKAMLGLTGFKAEQVYELDCVIS